LDTEMVTGASAITTVADVCDRSDAVLGRSRPGSWRSVEDGGARLLGGLEHQAGAQGIRNRSIGGSERCRTPSQVLPLPRNTVNTRRTRTAVQMHVQPVARQIQPCVQHGDGPPHGAPDGDNPELAIGEALFMAFSGRL
jgi:hypothetical protein